MLSWINSFDFCGLLATAEGKHRRRHFRSEAELKTWQPAPVDLDALLDRAGSRDAGCPIRS
jgi:hypothetical protein